MRLRSALWSSCRADRPLTPLRSLAPTRLPATTLTRSGPTQAQARTSSSRSASRREGASVHAALARAVPLDISPADPHNPDRPAGTRSPSCAPSWATSTRAMSKRSSRTRCRCSSSSTRCVSAPCCCSVEACLLTVRALPTRLLQADVYLADPPFRLGLVIGIAGALLPSLLTSPALQGADAAVPPQCAGSGGRSASRRATRSLTSESRRAESMYARRRGRSMTPCTRRRASQSCAVLRARVELVREPCLRAGAEVDLPRRIRCEDEPAQADWVEGPPARGRVDLGREGRPDARRRPLLQQQTAARHGSSTYVPAAWSAAVRPLLTCVCVAVAAAAALRLQLVRPARRRPAPQLAALGLAGAPARASH